MVDCFLVDTIICAESRLLVPAMHQLLHFRTRMHNNRCNYYFYTIIGPTWLIVSYHFTI